MYFTKSLIIFYFFFNRYKVANVMKLCPYAIKEINTTHTDSKQKAQNGKIRSICLSGRHTNSVRNLYLWEVWICIKWIFFFSELLKFATFLLLWRNLIHILQAFQCSVKTRPWNRAINSLLSFTAYPITKLQSNSQRSKKHERLLCEWLINMEKIIS